MYPERVRKPYGFLMFSGGRERMHWKQMLSEFRNGKTGEFAWVSDAIHISHYGSNHRKCFMEKRILKNFAKFTEKHLCQSLFFKKVAGLRGLQLY